MTNAARRRSSAPRKKQATPRAGDDVVPAIPAWFQNWGPTLLIPGGLVLLIAAGIGLRDGAPWGWALLLAVAVAIFGGWARGYLRRLDKNQTRLDRELFEASEFSLIDVMSGTDFEIYCSRLLPTLGYRSVEWIGRPGDDGVDIYAVDDYGAVAVQCKRYKHAIGPSVIHQISGAVAGGVHAGRRPVLMTNARVTRLGRKAAQERGVRVIGREELAEAIWQLRKDDPALVPDGETGSVGRGSFDRVGRYGHPSLATVTSGVVLSAVVTVLVVVMHALTAGPHHAAAAPLTPVTAPAARASSPVQPPGPALVVRDYYAAISRHDWPVVWRLGGRKLGEGPSASYQGMISGYRHTIRDVLTEVLVSGDTVSGRFLAYQTGSIRAYQFTFEVRDGAIVSGHAQYTCQLLHLVGAEGRRHGNVPACQ